MSVVSVGSTVYHTVHAKLSSRSCKLLQNHPIGFPCVIQLCPASVALWTRPRGQFRLHLELFKLSQVCWPHASCKQSIKVFRASALDQALGRVWKASQSRIDAGTPSPELHPGNWVSSWKADGLEDHATTPGLAYCKSLAFTGLQPLICPESEIRTRS